MVHENTLTFISELAINNNKPWFDTHKESYNAAKSDFEEFVGQVLAGLGAAEPEFLEQKAKDCVFRIFRDVRFSKDKTPYKAHFGASFSKGGRKFMGAGYYLHIEPGGRSFAGGGLWMPETPMLKAVRQEIDYNYAEFSAAIGGDQFKKYFSGIEGERVKTFPQGYTADNPAIDYLKMKSFVAMHHLEDDELKAEDFAGKVVGIFAAMRPFIDFLNRGIVAGK